MAWVLTFAVVIAMFLFMSMAQSNKKEAVTKHKESNEEAINNLQDDRQKAFNVMKQYLLKVIKDKKPAKTYPITFIGRGNHILNNELFCGAVSSEMCCVISEDGSVLDLRFSPFEGFSPFEVVKEKGKQHGTVMMDVQEAARIGNGLGGIGAAASAAANAAKINSEGGLKVEHTVSYHNLYYTPDTGANNTGSNPLVEGYINVFLGGRYATADGKVNIRHLWLNGESENMPSYKSGANELCDKLNSRIQALSE